MGFDGLTALSLPQERMLNWEVAFDPNELDVWFSKVSVQTIDDKEQNIKTPMYYFTVNENKPEHNG